MVRNQASNWLQVLPIALKYCNVWRSQLRGTISVLFKRGPFHQAHMGTKARNYAASRPTLCPRVAALSLAASLQTQARTQGHTGLASWLYPPLVGLVYGQAMAGLAHPARRPMASRSSTTRPSPKSWPQGSLLGRCGRRSWPGWRSSRMPSPATSAGCLATRLTRRPKRGGWTWLLRLHASAGSAGHCPHCQYWLWASPLPVAPVNETALGLVSEGLQALPPVAQEVGVNLRGASFTLAGGFEATGQRQGIGNTGMLPNRKENPRNRPKGGRKRLCTAALQALRMRVERSLAWEAKAIFGKDFTVLEYACANASSEL
jgi:hypothetical protein